MSWVTTTIPYLVVLCAASACWQFSRTSRKRSRFRPVATLTAVVLIGVSCTLQLTVAPFLLGDWQRNGFSGWLHQPYRLVTALLVQDGIGYLNVGATLPQYRRLGIHRAMSERRVQDARDWGCELLIGFVAGFGKTSQNNMERRGLRVAYNRMSWTV